MDLPRESQPTPPAQAPIELDRYAHLLEEARALKGVSLARDAWRRLRRMKVAIGSLCFLIALSLAAFLTPMLPMQPPRSIDTHRAFTTPTFRPLFTAGANWVDEDGQINTRALETGFGEMNWLNRGLVKLRVLLFGRLEMASLCGTDHLGRDMLARLFWGARVSLVVGLVATLVSLVIGVSYGAISGYVGGRLDNAMMRLVDVLYSVPFIFVVIYLISILSHPDVRDVLKQWHIDRITVFYFVVGAIYWLTMARVVRGQVISLKHDQFVEAARTIGASRARIIFLHIVPNLFSVVIVYLTLTIPRVMLFEAFLSFLGLGVEPPDVSWGLLANEGVRVITPIKVFWWVVVFPGVALGSTLFALNFLGDGLRDALDPRMKNR